MAVTSPVDVFIKYALNEDINSGDITTNNTIPETSVLRGTFLAKEDGVIAGLDIVRRVFALYDHRIIFTPRISEGGSIKRRMIIANVKGPGRSLLSTERVALNFLQRMSGIATQTRAFIEAVKGTKAIILDTRKTAPGLRFFDKKAVLLGGGQNHRFGLFDMVLIKDNHIAACGGVTQAIFAVRQKTRKPIIVEVRTLEELKESIFLHPNRIILDNMDVQMMRKAVQMVAGTILLEASGNVSLENIRNIAETGVDYISIGSLTHSVRALDISLEICE